MRQDSYLDFDPLDVVAERRAYHPDLMGAQSMLTEEQKALARHALGLPNESNRSYRNRYRAPLIGDVTIAWHAMRDAGYAVCEPVHGQSSLGSFFHLTETGARLALEKGETLDPEDFPAVAK